MVVVYSFHGIWSKSVVQNSVIRWRCLNVNSLKVWTQLKTCDVFIYFTSLFQNQPESTEFIPFKHGWRMIDWLMLYGRPPLNLATLLKIEKKEIINIRDEFTRVNLQKLSFHNFFVTQFNRFITGKLNLRMEIYLFWWLSSVLCIKQTPKESCD